MGERARLPPSRRPFGAPNGTDSDRNMASASASE